LTSRPIELLVSLTRGSDRTLGAQIEDQIRNGVRAGTLKAGALVPSTRDLAEQLGVSRPLVVEAYAQLAAEGYLSLRQGARPRVAAVASTTIAAKTSVTLASDPPPARFDFRPAFPDLASFPRAGWLRASRDALAAMTPEDFGYGGRHGAAVLCRALADYLGRVRGVVADPAQILVTSGFEQGRVLAYRALAAIGARRIAVEEPSYTEWQPLLLAGLELVPIKVDAEGMRVEELENARADAVLLTPAHQFPTGVVLSGGRRVSLLSWLRRRDAIAVEDDYDAEYRYDRAPVGALQGLDPEHVIYAGTASKTLAPALRMGWLVVPQRLLEAVRTEQRLADYGCPRIEQHTLAAFIESGEFDRHLRRMRTLYRARRDALVKALAVDLPEAAVSGIAAGLHATVRLPGRHDEQAIRNAAARRGVALEFLSEHYVGPQEGPATLLLGYARHPESALRAGVRALAAAVRAGRGV
jgi:GntR family transcriptional regulator/MocR family aminotransferase